MVPRVGRLGLNGGGSIPFERRRRRSRGCLWDLDRGAGTLKRASSAWVLAAALADLVRGVREGEEANGGGFQSFCGGFVSICLKNLLFFFTKHKRKSEKKGREEELKRFDELLQTVLKILCFVDGLMNPFREMGNVIGRPTLQ